MIMHHFNQRRYSYFDEEATTPGSIAGQGMVRSEYRYHGEAYPTPQQYSSGGGHYHDYHDKPENHTPPRRHQHSIMAEPPISPHENDVLMGRGGKNNQHSGNEKLRQLARTQCAKYRVSTKKGKSQISRDLVNRMRALSPPARFLKRDSDTGGWVDVGDDIAREKASQVLRDAVALLQDGELLETETSGEAGLETPQAEVGDGDRKPLSRVEDGVAPSDHQHHTPGLLVESSSFPPPTPIESSRKRQRYPHESLSEPLLYEPETAESPSRRRRSADDEPRDRSSLLNYNTVTSSSHHHRQSRNLDEDSANSTRGPFEEYSRRGYSRDYFMPPPPVPSSSSYPPPATSSPRIRYAQHPGSYMHSAATEPSNPGQWSTKSHPNGRPSVAARQASTASCQSLLGDVNGGTSGDFDLFGGELVFDVDENVGKKGSLDVPKAPSPR